MLTCDGKARAGLIVVLVAVVAGAACLCCGVWWMRHLGEGVLLAHREFLIMIRQGDVKGAYESMDVAYTKAHTLGEFRKMVRELADEPLDGWKCVWLSFGLCRVGRENGEGFVVGNVFDYVWREGRWRFTGNTRCYTD
jgi:hypothetical protein